MSDNRAAIELAAPRSFTLLSGENTFTLVTRRVTRDDWARYFAGLNITARQDGLDVVNAEEFSAARISLATSVLVSAVGYRVRNPEKPDVVDWPDWQQLIPLAHRLRVGNLLTSAARDDDDGFLYPEATPVTLSAAWGSDDAGNLQQYTGLIHYLKQPTDSQFRRYNRAASSSIIRGGTRLGETQFIGAQTVAADLYDELLVSVEGYTVNGAPLTSKAQIAAEMDTHHKVVAALGVLAPQQTVNAQTAGSEA